MTYDQRKTDYLSDLPPEIRALVDAVRRIVKDTAPEVEERIYKGGYGIGYHDRKTGSLCGLFPHDDGVALVFPKAMMLPDPDGLLKVAGEPGQYVFLRPGQPIPEEALAQLLLAALIFGAK